MASNNIKLLPGDVFCTSNPMLLGRMIRAAQFIWSSDNSVEFGHAGIIVDTTGKTLESLWTVRYGNLSAYAGKPVIIARPLFKLNGGQLNDFERAQKIITDKHLGQWYPVWRLIFHIFPPFAKFISLKRHLICSELVAKDLFLRGAWHRQYVGITPDILADAWIRWRNFEIIFKGIWG